MNKDERREYNRNYRLRNKEKIRVHRKKYEKTQKYKVQKRNWARNHIIITGGKKVCGVNKRPYTGYCELCGREFWEEVNKLFYHHWDDKDIKKGKEVRGIWLCGICHFMCEMVEKDRLYLVQRYLRFKRALDKKHKIEEKLKPQLN